jgi:hypothetical protein
MTKRAGDPGEVLMAEGVQKWLHRSYQESWFIAGHTRFATRGKVNRRNSHPFRYGRIIGSHNGMCDAPLKFNVDSEYLFWALNKHRGDYNKALGDVRGYWGLSWFDGNEFTLTVHNGDLALTEVEGVWYYSSDWKHLESCTGKSSRKLADGEVVKFNDQGLIGSSVTDPNIPKFESTAFTYYSTGSYYTSTGGTTTRRNYKSGGRGGYGKKAAQSWLENEDLAGAGSDDAKDYDTGWAQAWSEYTDQHTDDATSTGVTSIHSMTDEQWSHHEEQMEMFDRYSG